ncbi:sodium proton exchanger [Corchorus olitorius]|uniref:Sodium proton exchanger n=1 Tax=Corchorus olitorius TaxID=93759 RepID=A0A1R3L4F5_9ROSI|nr:sodium proton exchanger [Corchorus olitorius]
MPHPMVPSTSKAISSDPLVPNEYVKSLQSQGP